MHSTSPLQATLALDLQAQLGECPVWSQQEQCLYVVDISARRIYRWHPTDGRVDGWDTPQEPGCLALIRPGVLMVALRSGFARFCTSNSSWGELLEVEMDTQKFRFNDGRCDTAGRFWASTIYEPRGTPLAGMYCLEKGKVRLVLGPHNGQGVTTGNGLAFDAVRGWMYRSDTPAHLVYRHAYDRASGQPGPPQVFARMDNNRDSPDYGGRPDGAAVDSQGNYWSAQYGGARVLCLSPAGKAIAQVQVPALRPTMVAFGGADLRTLYITSARENASDAELERYPHSGGVFGVRVQTPGLAESSYVEG